MHRIARYYRLFRDFARRNQANAVEAYAAQGALFVVISFFPSAILLLALLPHLPFSEAQIADVFVQIIPDAIADFAQSILQELYIAPSIPLLSVSAALALWSASKGSVALMRGLYRIYGIHPTRGYVFLRLVASAYVLIFFVLLVLILVFLGFGGVLFDWLAGWIPGLLTSPLLRWGLPFLVSYAVLFLLFWLLYVGIPRRKHHPLREMPGALVAAGGWVGFSSLYSFYLDNIGRVSFYYGSLSLVMFSLLWLYFCMYIFFVGAEINVWLVENWPKGNLFRRRKS
ncbi:MAG: YihY/virulence factor BrkB family protein [Clostridia bacterium]|nr:YihY/virulence factor BrkB family protein [Clostridia bacterium]